MWIEVSLPFFLSQATDAKGMRKCYPNDTVPRFAGSTSPASLTCFLVNFTRGWCATRIEEFDDECSKKCRNGERARMTNAERDLTYVCCASFNLLFDLVSRRSRVAQLDLKCLFVLQRKHGISSRFH